MILKAMFWQLMDRDNRIRIPHPLPTRVVLITARRKPLESLAVFVFLYSKESLGFHG